MMAMKLVRTSHLIVGAVSLFLSTAVFAQTGAVERAKQENAEASENAQKVSHEAWDKAVDISHREWEKAKSLASHADKKFEYR